MVHSQLPSVKREFCVGLAQPNLETEGKLMVDHKTTVSQQHGVTNHCLTSLPAAHLSGEEKTQLAI